MKNIYLTLLLCIITSFSVFAQDFKSEYEVIKSVLQTEKRSFLKEFMNLTEEEEKIFWPIYEDYEIERAKYARKRLDALIFYVKNYDSMSESEANNFIDDIFDVQKNDIKLKKKFFRMLNGKIPTTKAVRFIELEEYLNSAIKLKLIESLPFVEE